MNSQGQLFPTVPLTNSGRYREIVRGTLYIRDAVHHGAPLGDAVKIAGSTRRYLHSPIVVLTDVERDALRAQGATFWETRPGFYYYESRAATGKTPRGRFTGFFSL